MQLSNINIYFFSSNDDEYNLLKPSNLKNENANLAKDLYFEF